MHTSTRIALVALLSLVLAPSLVLAQGDQPAKAVAEVKPQPQSQPYLLTFTIKESFGGKSAVERNYSLTVVADDESYHHNVSVRDSDRVALKKTDGGFDTFSVGADIDIAHVSRRGDVLIVDLRADSDSPVAKSVDGNFPETRNWKISIVAVLVPGKPTVVYTSADAVTDHKVEMVATAKPLS